MKLRRIQISNFRGITNLDLKVGDITVLIGENNTGKTAILDALRFALREVRSRRGCAFDSYDFHLATPESAPASAPAIVIRLTFREDAPGEWGDQTLVRLNRAKIVALATDGAAVVTLKVTGRFDAGSQEFAHDWEFQNAEGVAFTGLNGLGISWVVLADNDDQGAKDHQTVRSYLEDRVESKVLFVMSEANVEQHLCANGFVNLYYDLLSDQPRQKVTVSSSHVDYSIQVAKALPSKLKTHAAQKVIARIRETGEEVPILLKNVIAAAVELSTQP